MDDSCYIVSSLKSCGWKQVEFGLERGCACGKFLQRHARALRKGSVCLAILNCKDNSKSMELLGKSASTRT